MPGPGETRGREGWADLLGIYSGPRRLGKGSHLRVMTLMSWGEVPASSRRKSGMAVASVRLAVARRALC